MAGLGSVGSLRRGVLALLLAVAAAPVFAFDLGALMALLAQQRSGEAEFNEQRFVKGLDEPLVSSGTLSFAAPDRFVRKTLKPRPETMAVDANNVTLTRSGRSRSFTLDAAPEMAAIIEALRGTLTGNAQTMQRYFKTVVSGSTRSWTLELTPLESGSTGRVRSIRIGGRNAELLSIEMQLTDGDRSLMTINAASPATASPARPGGAASAP